MAEREIKTTLALDGEAQFKSALDEAYRGAKILGAEFKLNDVVFKENAGSMDVLTDRAEVLGKQIDQQKELVRALTQAVEESSQIYGENDKKTDAYRIKLGNAEVALARMEQQLGSTNKDIQNYGKETKDAEKKTIDWGAAAKKTGEIVGKSLATAAKATGAAMATVGAAAVAAGKKIFDITKETGVFADDLITMSQVTGISQQSLQEWAYAARFVDVEVSTITGSMTRMVKSMDAARDGTGATADVYRKLGITVTDASGQLRDQNAVFFEVIDALGQVTSETERDAMAMAILGKSARDLTPLINAGAEELQRLGQEAQDAGLIMSDEMVSKFGEFDDTMQVIDATMSGISRNLATIFLPAVQGAAAGAQDMLTTINKTLADGFQPEDVRAIGDAISQKIMQGLAGIQKYMPDVIAAVTSMLSGVLGYAVEFLPTLLPLLMNAAVSLLTGALQAIRDNIRQIAETVKVLVRSFVQFVTENLPLIIEVAIEIIIALALGLVQAIPDLVMAIPKIIEAIVGGLLGAIPQMLTIGWELIKGLWAGILEAGKWLLDKLTGWVGEVFGWLKGLFGIKSPSTLMRDMIGKPIVEGLALGITNNAGLVDDALESIIPGEKTMRLGLDAGRIGGRVVRSESTTLLSGAAVESITKGLVKALQHMPENVIVMNGREFGRAVRRVVPAT